VTNKIADVTKQHENRKYNSSTNNVTISIIKNNKYYNPWAQRRSSLLSVNDHPLIK
jgi:hypothetical protein